jgi:hypothetical protein
MDYTFNSTFANIGNISIIEPARVSRQIEPLEGALPFVAAEIQEIATH